MKLYRSHLKPLALALAILSLLIIAAGLPLMRFFPGRSPGISPLYILARCVLGLLSAAVAWFTACRNRHYRTAFILSAALLAAAVTLTILFGGNKLDDLTDIMTLMMLLLAYTLLRANQSERRWKRILARKGTVLDLKIGSRDDLFNPIVLAPHLEINGAVVDAVDHYLATAGKNAPLTLCLHCAERISVPLQETLREVYRSHYEDEERRVSSYLKSRYSRGIFLLLLSIGALTVWERFMRQYSTSTLWQVLGNFAAFSLWQIGNTYFERSEALGSLAQILIAKHAEIQFL